MRRMVFSCANRTALGLLCWTIDKPGGERENNQIITLWNTEIEGYIIPLLFQAISMTF